MSARPTRRPARRGNSARGSAAATARTVAFETIHAVNTSDAYANLLLPAAIRRAGLAPADAALATELTYGTLRREGTYDAVIAVAADRSVDRIDPPVLDALRLGAHQVMSTRIASHAAVNETVELVRITRGVAATGFTNAVMRRIARDTPGEWMQRITASARSDDEALALAGAHPVWVIRAFRRALAAEGRADELDALLSADNAAPRVTMAALPGLAEPDPHRARTTYSSVGFRLDAGDPESLVADSGGTWRVQDEGSQLVALALAGLDLDVPERWLDLCAGPGGKTALLAAVARQRGIRLDANEIVPARAGLVRRAVAAVPGEVEVSEADGRELLADPERRYSRILVDAPCTGLGALRRRPEARWRKQPGDVAELVQTQTALLSAAVGALEVGGVVAYVTCSPHLAETQGVVAEVLGASEVALESVDARTALQSVARTPLELPERVDGSAYAQLWPHRHGTDAMFLALLRRTG